MATDFDLFTMSAGFGQGFDSSLDLFGGAGTFTSINDSSAASDSIRTVSPKDLFNDAGLSAPPSTAFTNLTSPDINSPLGIDSYETSPMFAADDFNSANQEKWFPLFPNDGDASNTSFTAQPLERTVSTASNAQSSASSTNNSPLVLDTHNRRKSSVASPTMSSYAGVKSRRRKQPLPPIAVDPSDKVALKRARNTLAARESRQRKLDHLATLEEQVRKLEAEREIMAVELAKWKSLALENNPTMAQS